MTSEEWSQKSDSLGSRDAAQALMGLFGETREETNMEFDRTYMCAKVYSNLHVSRLPFKAK